MESLIKYYENNVFMVWIDKKEYTAIFRFIDDEIVFEINHYKTLDYESNKRFDTLEGFYEDRNITIINSYIFSYDNQVVMFKFDMMLDGILLKNNEKNKKIKSFKSSYYGIEGFDLLSCINYDVNNNLKLNCENDSFNIREGIIEYCRNSEIIYTKKNVIINKDRIIKINYMNEVDVYKVVKDVWHFKNLLSIFSKKEIGVKLIKVYSDNDNEAILFMNMVRQPKYKYKNEILEILQNKFFIHYEEIKDEFSNIYEKSCECFERINPILQIYLDNLESEIPKLNKFLSFNQMIEGFSREYYNKESIDEMYLNDKTKKSKKDCELKYRISYLIKKVNFIYNLESEKIMKISQTISTNRNYYTHYDKTKKENILKTIDLIKYTYFLEDVLLANIYLKLGINEDVVKDAFIQTPFYKVINL